MTALSRCTNDLRKQGVAYPRTCQECGLGPCKRYPRQLSDDEKYLPEARYIVEEHIRHFGMVPHPDVLKAAIATALSRLARGVSPV